MANLRDLKDRIGSVKSTKKITSAMKMVAASKLKKAQEQAEASQPYADAMGQMLGRVAQNVVRDEGAPRLLVGTNRDEKHLLIVVTSDRGLCGGFNSNLVRQVRQEIRKLEAEEKKVSLVCVGRKGLDSLKRTRQDMILEKFLNIGAASSKISYSEADDITKYVLEQFDEGAFDVCTIVYNEFKSVLIQKPKFQQLIPFDLDTQNNDNGSTGQNDSQKNEEKETAGGPVSLYEFEPDEEEILSKLLPKNLGIQIFRALLDSAAGEQAARMTAMDNATRNAGDMIDDLTLLYNRERQAAITNELIEIISGAEAL